MNWTFCQLRAVTIVYVNPTVFLQPKPDIFTDNNYIYSGTFDQQRLAKQAAT